MESGFYRKFLVIVLIASVLLLGIENINAFTGYASNNMAPSNVTIVKSVAISFSTNLGEGVLFEEVRFLPATNVNASHNYDDPANGTGYFVAVSSDSNTAVDLCLKADGPLTTLGGDTIPLSGETYSAALSTDSVIPDVLNEVSMTTNYSLVTSDIPVGGYGYMRFFLDVPVAQAPGDYQNNLFFKGNVAGILC